MATFGKNDSDSDFAGLVGSEGNMESPHKRKISPFSDKTVKLSYEGYEQPEIYINITNSR
jgi:hypothetical protein